MKLHFLKFILILLVITSCNKDDKNGNETTQQENNKISNETTQIEDNKTSNETTTQIEDNKTGNETTQEKANFSTYVAIGNSLTAGFMDGTVYKSGQKNSFPNILSKQFASVGGGNFTQPSFEEDSNDLGGINNDESGITLNTRLVVNRATNKLEMKQGISTITKQQQKKTAFNNMGVPGAKSFDVIAKGYGSIEGASSNPYFVRHATSSDTSILDDAMSLQPTFFTCFIGSNDVLYYALNGGANKDNSAAKDHNKTNNLLPETYNSNDITNAEIFKTNYKKIIDRLTSNNAKGVVATIPDITLIPYFTTIHYNALQQISKDEIDKLNELYSLLKKVCFMANENNRINKLNATNNKHPILIYDDDAFDLSELIHEYIQNFGKDELKPLSKKLGKIFGKSRQATEEDLILLHSSLVLGKKNPKVDDDLSNLGIDIVGVSYPLPNKYVLTKKEQKKVNEATKKYNDAIRNIATEKKLGILDSNTTLSIINQKLRIMPQKKYTHMYFNGATEGREVYFSLDGIHPNAKGYALLANEFIKVINETYNLSLLSVDPNKYPGLQFVNSN